MVTKQTIVLPLCFIIFTCSSIHGQPIDAHLSILEPLLNKNWSGILEAPDGSDEWEVVRHYIPIKGGKVIKCTKENDGLESYGEGFFYWNDIEKKIAFFFIENNGVYLDGFVSASDSLITIQGKMNWPVKHPPVNQSYDFKNEFELRSNDVVIDRWFHTAFGPWRPGHVITFRAGS